MWTRGFLGVLAFSLGIALAWIKMTHLRHVAIFSQVCSLVFENFYESSEELSIWHQDCLGRATSLPYFLSKSALVSKIEKSLSRMDVSHLAITSPVENRMIWNSRYREVGIRAREVEGYFVVSSILPNSSAAKAGLRPGDLIAAINGESVYSVATIQFQGGWYEFVRDGNVMQAHLSPSEVVLDESPKLHWLEGSVAHLTIPSFRGDHFFKQKWTPIVEGLSKVRRLIVDLRGNRGGNFVAMLRALSTFYCGVAEAGRLYQSRRQAGTVLKFLDDVDQDVQLSVVDRAQEVNLVTFPGYGCYRGSVVVLVDEGTSSVSEIFAQALKEKNKVQIMGQRTAGDVLLAVIYPLTQLGGDYSLYVPQMNFMSLGGHRIERAGVEPQYTLDYRLDEAEKGVDSWIQRALEKGP